MIRIPFPADVTQCTEVRIARSLCQRPPHLRSNAVVLPTATSGDAAEIAAQKRIDRIVIGACLAAALALAVLMLSGAVR